MPTSIGVFSPPRQSLLRGSIVSAVAWLVVVCPTLPATAAAQVCDRTPQVRYELVEVTGASGCGAVTDAQLASVTRLDISDSGINELREDDFSGLTSLQTLLLYNNSLTELPEEIFGGLKRLQDLWLSGNSLKNPREGIFDGLSNLKQLLLGGNPFGELPGGIFSGLSSLRELSLNSSRLTALPAGIFDGLDALEILDLRVTLLSTIPEGIFDDVIDTLGTNNGFGGLLVETHLMASVAFASSVQYGLKGALVRAKVILSRPLPVAVRLPYSLGGSATADDYSDLSPNPDNGLLFLAGERVKDIAFQLSASRPPGKTIVLTLGELTQIGLLASDGSGKDAPHMMAEVLIERPPADAVHSVTVIERDAVSDSGGVCGRTAQVRGKLMAAAGVSNCMEVTTNHLSAVTLLDLRDSGIMALAEDDFKGLSSLETLLLNYNFLSSVPNGVFDDLSALYKLRLSANSLTSLPEGVFNGLGSLATLDLAENSLVGLPEGLFSDLSSLKDLSLYHNSLVALPEGLFRGLKSLERLRLYNNFLATIPQPIFKGLGNLRRLYLNDNSLVSLPQGIFENLIYLERLWIFTNSLNGLPEGVFAGLSNLQLLLLSNNQLSLLSEDVFSGLSALDNLSLYSNQLTVLPKQIYSDLSKLRYLSLHNNSLSELPGGIFSSMSQLEELDLSSNALSSPPENIFHGLSTLRRLILWGNGLEQLPEGIFGGLHFLQDLVLSHNSLSSLPEGIFRGLYSVRRLYLGENRLTELPGGIFDDMLDSLGLEIEGNFLIAPIPGLSVDPHLKATLSFASTVQKAAGGTTLRVPATLSRALPVAVRVPFKMGFSGTEGEVADLAPTPDKGLRFLAGETRAEISFTVPKDDDTRGKRRILLSLGKASEVGLRRSDGEGPDAPYLKTESLLLRSAQNASHTINVSDFDPTEQNPYCFSLWEGTPCSTAANLPHVFTGILGESRATTEVIITHTDPTPAHCEVAVLFHRGTSPAPAVAFNGQFPDRNLFRTTVARGGAKILTLASPDAGQLTTGALYVFARSPCTADSFQVQGRVLLENPADGDIEELYSLTAQSQSDWLGHGNCQVLTGMFGNGRNLEIASVTAEPGLAAPAGTRLLFKAFDLEGEFIDRLSGLEVSGAHQALTPWEFDQPTTLQMCLDAPGNSDFQLAVTAIGTTGSGAKVQYSTEPFITDREPEEAASGP